MANYAKNFRVFYEVFQKAKQENVSIITNLPNFNILDKKTGTYFSTALIKIRTVVLMINN